MIVTDYHVENQRIITHTHQTSSLLSPFLNTKTGPTYIASKTPKNCPQYNDSKTPKLLVLMPKHQKLPVLLNKIVPAVSIKISTTVAENFHSLIRD